MRYIFKSLIVLSVVSWCLTVMAQPVGDNQFEQSPNLQKHPIDRNQEAIWDLLLGFDVTALSGAAGNAGAEWDGTYLYSTRWGSNLIHKYDATGTTLIEEFSIPGVTGLRDLAFDGQYMYGGAAANTIYMMDFTTKTLIGTIPSPVGVRFIAYDEVSDAFWCGNWSDPATLVSRTGTTITSFTTSLAGQYGAAYDNVSPGGPFLWIFDQGGGAGTAQLIHQFNISTGTATGVTHDVTLQFPTASGIAGGLFSMCDWQAGTFTIGGLLQGTPDNIFIYEIATCGPPCPVGAPDNPNPINGATNVSINLANISWTNGAGTTQVELQFGESGSMTTVYSGAPITSWAIPGQLDYMTTYNWKVIDKNDTCSTFGPTWAFTTIPDPNLSEWCDAFANLQNWTVVGPMGMTNWSASNTALAGGTAPELYMSWSPSFTGVSTIRSVPIPLLDNWPTNYSFNFFLDFYANPSGVVTVSITYDGGATSTPLYTLTDPTGNVGPVVQSGSFTTPVSGASNAQIEISYNGYSFNIDAIAWDNMCLDWIVPVELTSFTASADFGVVELRWFTATETNNQGFEVQRSAGGEFETIGFVEGHGTTTEVQAYTYSDRSVAVGSYSYRLKQVDFDGTTTYSSIVEVNVPAPAEFALDQNYPNPFNPSTKIAFRLAVDSKVSLKVFDVLGQEVASLVNGNLVAGGHSVDFDASSLNSGVYLYRIEATGVDGSNFVDVKKMILTK
ncbi:MAG: hypothetical protein AMXMBFR51_30660 [Ignavibacteriota bacterium]